MIFYIRTKHITKSRPSNTLLILTTLTVIATITVPIILSNFTGFNFVLLPVKYYFYLVGLVVLYGIIAQTVKKIYIKKYDDWL
jgi:Mg2+-importing ATPase